MKYTKEHIKIENTFKTEILPLLNQISELCIKYNLPMVSAIELFEDSEKGARLVTRTFSVENDSIPITLCSSILQGKAKIVISGDSSFNVTLDTDNNEEDDFYENESTESLEEHIQHCESCKEDLNHHVENNENLSNIHVVKHHEDEDYDDSLPFIIPKDTIIH